MYNTIKPSFTGYYKRLLIECMALAIQFFIRLGKKNALNRGRGTTKKVLRIILDPTCYIGEPPHVFLFEFHTLLVRVDVCYLLYNRRTVVSKCFMEFVMAVTTQYC